MAEISAGNHSRKTRPTLGELAQKAITEKDYVRLEWYTKRIMGSIGRHRRFIPILLDMTDCLAQNQSTVLLAIEACTAVGFQSTDPAHKDRAAANVLKNTNRLFKIDPCKAFYLADSEVARFAPKPEQREQAIGNIIRHSKTVFERYDSRDAIRKVADAIVWSRSNPELQKKAERKKIQLEKLLAKKLAELNS